jgi:predicted nucleotidyltransferase
MDNIPQLDKIVSLIVSQVSPDKIILFGSYARGDNHPKSDIDLLILKRGFKKQREAIGLLYRSFLDNEISIPVDLLALDSDRYEEISNQIGYIYKTIKQEGKVIYGKV